MAIIRIILLLCLSISICHAEIISWKIIPHDSHIYFTATQNNAPVKGEFKQFTGQIKFSPNDLANSSVNLSIDLNSIATTYAPIADTLKTSLWFDVKLFPTAQFESKEFTQLPDGSFNAVGILTLRKTSIPITLHFTLEDLNRSTAHAKGQTTLKRSDFGIGSGEWEKTDVVHDNVGIDFVIHAERI